MNCKLFQNIKHSCEYNSGGISNIYLLDIKDFQGYRFQNDSLFNSCYVDRVLSSRLFTELDVTNESNFTENNDGYIYTQTLTTFIRSLKAGKLSDILLSSSNKYIVAFRTMQNEIFCFGSDEGASISFTQTSGILGESSGYLITITKKSIYPLFEVNPNYFNLIRVLGSESGKIIKSENSINAILI